MTQQDKPHIITSANIPTTLKTRLDNAEVGNSELIRDLLERYFYLRDEADKGEVNNIQQRVKEIKEKVEEKEDEKESLEAQISAIENDLAALKQEKEMLLDQLREKKVSKDRVVREVNNSQATKGDLR